MGRFEAVDGNGIRFVADLKEKGMGRSLEDLKVTGVRWSKGGVGGRGEDKNHWEGEKIDRQRGRRGRSKGGGCEGAREGGVERGKEDRGSVIRRGWELGW
jgi:hypothetical protein